MSKRKGTDACFHGPPRGVIMTFSALMSRSRSESSCSTTSAEQSTVWLSMCLAFSIILVRSRFSSLVSKMHLISTPNKISLKIISINIRGGREAKKGEIQMWAIKHNPDILLLHETWCNKSKHKFVNLPGYRNFGNCLSQKYMTYLQKTTGNNLTSLLNNCKIVAKWGTITLIKEELSDISFDATPAVDWAKGRVCAAKLGNQISPINMFMHVYAPAGDRKKWDFYHHLTEWAKGLEGE